MNNLALCEEVRATCQKMQRTWTHRKLIVNAASLSRHRKRLVCQSEAQREVGFTTSSPITAFEQFACNHSIARCVTPTVQAGCPVEVGGMRTTRRFAGAKTHDEVFPGLVQRRVSLWANAFVVDGLALHGCCAVFRLTPSLPCFCCLVLVL